MSELGQNPKWRAMNGTSALPRARDAPAVQRIFGHQTKLPNATLSAHSAFRTPEASEDLTDPAWEHCRRIAATI